MIVFVSGSSSMWSVFGACLPWFCRFGILSLPRKDEDIGVEEQEGYWEHGKLHGLGTIR